MKKQIFFVIIPGYETISVFHIKSFHCPQNVHGKDFFTFASGFVFVLLVPDLLLVLVLRRCHVRFVPLPALAAALGPGPFPGVCLGWCPRALLMWGF